MFRRLAELTNNSVVDGFDVDTTHGQFIAGQSERYNNTLVNAIPTMAGLPAPNELQNAVVGVNPLNGSAVDSHRNLPSLFTSMQMPGQMQRQEQVCQTATIDGLLSSQNESKPIRCGWMYSPPPTGSPIPTVSRGAIGTVNGPINFNGPTNSHTQWYWSIEDAKKRALVDKCKALRNCADVNTEPYNGICGYCSDIGQGIPVDANGRPLYTDSPLTGCSSGSIVTRAGSCPPPPDTGVNLNTNQTCTPIGGRLPFGCLDSILHQGGCSTDGALSIALSTGATPRDYMATARNLESMDLYNKKASQPFNINIFSDGQATVAMALQEASNLASNANTKPANSAIGAAARDLCLRKGALDQYNFCADIPLTSPPPYNLSCLQRAFREAGGQAAGTKYPTTQNINSLYNVLPMWKNVIDYINRLASNASSTGEYTAQQTALNDFLGIRPEDPIYHVNPLPDTSCKKGTFMYGNWIGKNMPIQKSTKLNTGECVYMFADPVYTKMVTESGVAKYYPGPLSLFNANNWNSYNDAGGNYILGR